MKSKDQIFFILGLIGTALFTITLGIPILIYQKIKAIIKSKNHERKF
jgi:hypothetical protein